MWHLKWRLLQTWTTNTTEMFLSLWWNTCLLRWNTSFCGEIYGKCEFCDKLHIFGITYMVFLLIFEKKINLKFSVVIMWTVIFLVIYIVSQTKTKTFRIENISSRELPGHIKEPYIADFDILFLHFLMKYIFLRSHTSFSCWYLKKLIKSFLHFFFFIYWSGIR